MKTAAYPQHPILISKTITLSLEDYDIIVEGFLKKLRDIKNQR